MRHDDSAIKMRLNAHLSTVCSAPAPSSAPLEGCMAGLPDLSSSTAGPAPAALWTASSPLGSAASSDMQTPVAPML